MTACCLNSPGTKRFVQLHGWAALGVHVHQAESRQGTTMSKRQLAVNPSYTTFRICAIRMSSNHSVLLQCAGPFVNHHTLMVERL
jgi:hypothetical protein